MNDKKLMNLIYIALIIPIILFIILFILFFFSVNKVYALDYINFYNNNGVLKRCEQTNTCVYNIPSYTGYEFGNSISLTTNIDLTVRIQYTTEYYYKNWTINESGLYVFLRGSSITPLTCTDSGNQTTTGSDWVTKTYNHNIICTLTITGTNAYEIGLAMTVSQVEGTNYSAFVTNTLNITKFEVSTTPNTTGIENAINSGNTNIINNSNQNTQTIIDNQNNNNQAVIDNQNQNTDRLKEAIENQNKKCENIGTINSYIEGYVLTSTGDLSSNSNYKTTNYYNISENTYTLSFASSPNSYTRYCLYNENKVAISCDTATQNLTINNTNAKYIRVGLQKSNTLTITGEYCYNLLEKQNETSENIESALTDSSVNDPTSSLNGLNANIGNNSVISDLLLLPVTLYQSVLNNINGSCSAFILGTMYGHQLKMPCLNVSGVIGNAIYGVIDILISGFFILSIRKKFVDIFNHFTSLKVGGNELE